MLPAVKKWLRRGIAVLASLALWLLLILGALLLIDGYATSIIRHEIALIRQKGEPVTLADIPDSKGNLHLEPQKQLISALQHASDVFNEVEEAFDYGLLISSGFEIGENGRMKFRDEVALLDDFANKPQYQSQYSKLLEAHKRIGKIETKRISKLQDRTPAIVFEANRGDHRAASLTLNYFHFSRVTLALNLRQKKYQAALKCVQKQVEFFSLVQERVLIDFLINITKKNDITDQVAFLLGERDLPDEVIRGLREQCLLLETVEPDLKTVYRSERAFSTEYFSMLLNNQGGYNLISGWHPIRFQNYFQYVLMKCRLAMLLKFYREVFLPFVDQLDFDTSYLSLSKKIKDVLENLDSAMSYIPHNKKFIDFHHLFIRSFETYVKDESAFYLALTACSVELFRREKGRLPEKLEELVPEYLEQVPSDPFDGEPLRYAPREDGTFLLYSVGKNLTDDGGYYRDEKGKVPHWTSSQDIVWPQPPARESMKN